MPTMKNRFKHLDKDPEDKRFWVAEGELHAVAPVNPELYTGNLAKTSGEQVFYFVCWKSHAKHNDKWYKKQVKCYNKKEAKSVYQYAKKQDNTKSFAVFSQKEKYSKVKYEIL